MAAARTTARKKPRQARSRATVDAILTATARILVREGYGKMTTNRVAEVAGVSVGSLYQYFPNKESLVAALVDRHLERMSRLVATELRGVEAAPLEVAVETVIATLVAAQQVEPKLYRVIVEQLPRLAGQDKIKQFDEQILLLMHGYLCSRSDSLSVQNLPLAAFVVLYAIKGTTLAALFHPLKDTTRDQLVRETTQLVLRYLTG